MKKIITGPFGMQVEVDESPVDKVSRIVDTVLSDFGGRSGLGDILDEVSEETLEDIKESLNIKITKILED